MKKLDLKIQIDWVVIFTQVVLWGLFIFIFLLVSVGTGSNWLEAFFRLKYAVPFLLSLITGFLINYLWLIPTFLRQKKVSIYIIANVITLFFMHFEAGVLVYLIMDLKDYDFTLVPQIPEELRLAAQLGFFLIYFLIILCAVFLHVQQWNRKLLWEAEIQAKEKASNELERLKGQLNPHFLFNTLNNISSLSAFDPDATQISISKLSDMLRYVLYDSSAAQVPLHKDLDFLQNYIDLMNIRYVDTLKLDVQLQTSHPELMVPPMLCISLLENAYKYGASSLHPCFITVQLVESETELTFIVRNSLLTTEELNSKYKGGIGFDNLEKRLELLFPGEHLLSYGEIGDGEFESKLTIHLKK